MSRLVDALRSQLGIDFESPEAAKTLVVYGQPGVGKSVLAVAIASELAGEWGATVYLYATEPNYVSKRYRSSVLAFAKELEEGRNLVFYDPKELSSMHRLLYRLVNPGAGKGRRPQGQGPVVIVVDSLNAFTDAYAVSLLRQGIDDVRPISGRVNPVARLIARAVKQVLVDRGGAAILVAHASSTAGTGDYRGVEGVQWKPSFTMRVDHYANFEVYVESHGPGGERTLVCTMNKEAPEAEGKRLRIRIASGRIEVVG